MRTAKLYGALTVLLVVAAGVDANPSPFPGKMKRKKYEESPVTNRGTVLYHLLDKPPPAATHRFSGQKSYNAFSMEARRDPYRQDEVDRLPLAAPGLERPLPPRGRAPNYEQDAPGIHRGGHVEQEMSEPAPPRRRHRYQGSSLEQNPWKPRQQTVKGYQPQHASRHHANGPPDQTDSLPSSSRDNSAQPVGHGKVPQGHKTTQEKTQQRAKHHHHPSSRPSASKRAMKKGIEDNRQQVRKKDDRVRTPKVKGSEEEEKKKKKKRKTHKKPKSVPGGREGEVRRRKRMEDEWLAEVQQ